MVQRRELTLEEIEQALKADGVAFKEETADFDDTVLYQRILKHLNIEDPDGSKD